MEATNILIQPHGVCVAIHCNYPVCFFFLFVCFVFFFSIFRRVKSQLTLSEADKQLLPM